jgi:hypothetical protein
MHSSVGASFWSIMHSHHNSSPWIFDPISCSYCRKRSSLCDSGWKLAIVIAWLCLSVSWRHNGQAWQILLLAADVHFSSWFGRQNHFHASGAQLLNAVFNKGSQLPNLGLTRCHLTCLWAFFFNPLPPMPIPCDACHSIRTPWGLPAKWQKDHRRPWLLERLVRVPKNTSHILVDYPSNISQKKGILKIKNPTLAAQCTSRVCTENNQPNTHGAKSTRKGTTNRCVLVGYVQQGVRVWGSKNKIKIRFIVAPQ